MQNLANVDCPIPRFAIPGEDEAALGRVFKLSMTSVGGLANFCEVTKPGLGQIFIPGLH